MRFLLCFLLVFLFARPADIAQAADVACAVTSTTVSAAKNRIRLALQNKSDVEICLNLQGGVATIAGALCLDAGQDLLYDEQRGMPREAITCIHAGTGTKILGIEEKLQ